MLYSVDRWWTDFIIMPKCLTVFPVFFSIRYSLLFFYQNRMKTNHMLWNNEQNRWKTLKKNFSEFVFTLMAQNFFRQFNFFSHLVSLVNENTSREF